MVTDMQELDGHSLDEEIIIDNGTGVEVEDTSGEEKITEPFNPVLIRVDTRPMTSKGFSPPQALRLQPGVRRFLA